MIIRYGDTCSWIKFGPSRYPWTKKPLMPLTLQPKVGSGPTRLESASGSRLISLNPWKQFEESCSDIKTVFLSNSFKKMFIEPKFTLRLSLDFVCKRHLLFDYGQNIQNKDHWWLLTRWRLLMTKGCSVPFIILTLMTREYVPFSLGFRAILGSRIKAWSLST